LGLKILHLTKEKMIMTLQAGEKLMSLTDVSEMLGIPVHTLYRWRHNGDGPAGYRVGRHVRYRREAVEGLAGAAGGQAQLELAMNPERSGPSR
jgi:excisionase family DNA binding protein